MKENDIGFSGIGKRIENLQDDITTENTTGWTQNAKTEIPEHSSSDKPNIFSVDWGHDTNTETHRQTGTDNAKKQRPPKTDKPTAGLPFHISTGKIFWGIVLIAIIVFIVLQNKDKKESNYAPEKNIPLQRSGEKWTGSTKVPNDKAIIQHSAPSSTDDNVITGGKYMCSRYHHNQAQKIEPSDFEKQDIERQQNILDNESQKVDVLNEQIKTTHVDRSSEESIDYYNIQIKKYNRRLEALNINTNTLQRKIDNYNSKVNYYNNYLENNCRKAY